MRLEIRALLVIVLAFAVFAFPRRGRTQNSAPVPTLSPTEETLERWDDIGKKLVAMAQDFPEDKYDYKLQKDERTFAQNLLHVAGVDLDLIRAVSGSNIGPDLGENAHNPPREKFISKADVVKLIQEAVADGARIIQQEGDAGLKETMKFAWAGKPKIVHRSYLWTIAIEHSGEHYGQLVVYYRANNIVPPDSRR